MKVKFLFIFIMFLSCESFVDIYVSVKDSESKVAVSYANIYVINENGRAVDSLRADINGIVKKSTLVGCIPRCPDYYLKVFAQNYDTFQTKESVRAYLKNSLKVIYLVKVK